MLWGNIRDQGEAAATPTNDGAEATKDYQVCHRAQGEEAGWLLWGSTPEPRRSCSKLLLMMMPRQPRIIRYVTGHRWKMQGVGKRQGGCCGVAHQNQGEAAATYY